MPNMFVFALLVAVAVGTTAAAHTSQAGQPAVSVIAAAAHEGDIVPVQYYGPGSGTGTGGGGTVRCRIVRVPGSGMGPRRVCERVPRCRIVRIPGSGRGPQRVCD
jgi:hypothetical protein